MADAATEPFDLRQRNHLGHRTGGAGGSCTSCDVHGSASVAGDRDAESDRSPHLDILGNGALRCPTSDAQGGASAAGAGCAGVACIHAVVPGARLRFVSALAVVGLHMVAGYALLRIEAVRQVVQEAAPLFVEFVRPAAAPSASPALVPKVVVPPKPKAPLPLIATPTPGLTPATFDAPPLAPASVSPALEAPVASVAAIIIPPAPLAPPTPQPKLVSGVEYVRPPQPGYPMISRRMNEEGKVIVRVLINPQGRPEQALAHLSSGSSRLDQAAINAVLAALFKPYTENGIALHAYALIPIMFELRSVR
ncbi:MAG: energy transducer TonB [Gammaproteobacteria bacterium]